MAITASIYPQAIVKAFSGEIDFDTDTFKLMLLNNSHTFNTAHNYLDDVSANEITGTGYTAGGPTLDSISVASSGNTVTIDVADEVIASATLTAYAAVVYKSTGTASTSPIIATYISDTAITASGGDWSFTPSGSGLATITCNA